MPDLWPFLSGMARACVLYPLAERMQKRVVSPKLRVLRREAALPFAARKAAALARLGDALEHAGATVPYYRDLFARVNFDPAKVRRDARYLEELPFLTKDILREQGRRLVSEAYLDRLAREQKTGSSTGPAALIYYDQESLDWTAAQNVLMLEWGGKRRYDREVHLSTRFVTPPPPEALRFEARKCLVMNRCNVYTDGFGDAAQERLLADLRAAKARVVQGHASSLAAFARWLAKGDTKALLPSGLFEIFVSTGEMMSPAQRALIENTLGARVSDRYGACEFGVMAQELANGPKGELLVNDSLVWPELFEPDARGEGELVFTNLRNPAMPLIRYRMGDLGTLEERPDAPFRHDAPAQADTPSSPPSRVQGAQPPAGGARGGSASPVPVPAPAPGGWWISKITGRVHDQVEIGGQNYPTHYIQDILDRCGNIADFQILTREGKAVEFRLVADEAAWEGVAAAVAANFPGVPTRRIDLEDLVFVGVRGKFSYLLREGS